MTTAYPLAWPDGWPRTRWDRQQSDDKFRGRTYGLTIGRVRDELLAELRRLGAKGVVISSNMRLRQDGLPYSDQGRIDDKGVAVYFTLKGRALVMASDRYRSIEGNLRSIGMAIEAMRQLERHGGGTMMDRAFAGFTALPSPKSCWEILGLSPGASAVMIEAAWRQLAAVHHPDRGGSTARMAEINAARDEALKGAAA
ncbi:MAG: J domain-containing protein [Gammaproteobacteria bacterium]|nr:J domain-containing protein [Gammaproteobacteria bacterium]